MPTITNKVIKEYGRASTRMPTTTDKVIKQYGRAVVSFEMAFELNEALKKSYHPHLKDENCFLKCLKGDLKKHGDYICFNILRACEILRSKDPNFFKKEGPQSIAQAIVRNFPKSDMLEEPTILDVGFLTFKLNGDWMAKRIRKNLKDGIAAWAPISPTKRVIFDFTSQVDFASQEHADGVRSRYIRDMLDHMLTYCGVEVSGKKHNDEYFLKVKKYLPEEEGVIRNKRKLDMKEEASRKAQPNNFHADLAALWFGFKEQNAQWIIYVTPVRQREYVMKCFDAAKAFLNENDITLSYLGYKTSGKEQGKLASLWKTFETSSKGEILRQGIGMASGYSAEEIFECTIKYAYLKNQTYSGCTFEIKEMLDEMGNTFLHLLKARGIIHAFLKNSRPNLKSNKALVDREREMGLHLLQFTEIIEEAILGFFPHLLCEYLFNLSKNFTSYIDEAEPSESGVLLCKAAEVVMEKGFDLLGITPESSKGLPSYCKQQTDKRMAIPDHRIPLPDSSNHWVTSRFEIFSMFVEVTHSNFEKGNLFGGITVSDTFGLRPDGWCTVDKKGCGHVSYFHHDWHDSVGIYDTSFLSIGDPSSCHSVPLSSSSIEVGVYLWATSKKKDACYQLCNVKKEIPLAEFWRGVQRIERSTFYAQGKDGSISIYYFLLKDAVDTSMKLMYELTKRTDSHPKVCGHILAYYGGDALDDCVGFNKVSYKAVVFRTDPAQLVEGDLTLTKSALAVPTKGVLVFEAFFQDVDSGEIIVNAMNEYRAEHEGKNSEWRIAGKKCSFTLTVDWIRGEGCR